MLYSSILFHKFFIETCLKLIERGYRNLFKTLVSLALCLIIVFFYFDEKNTISPVFHLTETPVIVTKGQFGASLLVEVSYSHEGFDDWIATLSKPYPLFLVDADWILRSPDTVELLIERNIPVGLLGSTQEEYKADDRLIERQLTVYEKNFSQVPLWFVARDYLINEKTQQTLHDRGINLLAPMYSFTTLKTKIADGDFISIPLHRDTTVSFQELQHYITSYPFLSIEENLFGYELQTKRMP